MNQSRTILFLLTILAPIAYAKTISQKDIPLTITKPGTYTLKENIAYKGSKNAITINGDNITVDFNGFALSLSKKKAIGVLAENISNFTIENGSFNAQVTTGNGIKVVKSNQGIIKNNSVNKTFNGLYINQSQDIQVLNSNFSEAGGSGVLVQDSTNVTFNNDTFADSNNGLTLSGANENIMLANSTFP